MYQQLKTRYQQAELARITGHTLEKVAREWHSKYKNEWTPSHTARILERLETDIFERYVSATCCSIKVVFPVPRAPRMPIQQAFHSIRP